MDLLLPSWVRYILESEDDVVFVLNRTLHIDSCNPGWDKFSAANGGAGISRAEVHGRHIFDFIPDVLVTFYEQKYSEAFRSGHWIGFDYECSSPEEFRLFHMAMRSIENSALLVVNSYLPDQRSPLPTRAITVSDSAYASPNGIIIMCAHCRRTKRQHASDTWDWVPRFLRLSGRNVSPGLCPRCVAYLYPESSGSKH